MTSNSVVEKVDGEAFKLLVNLHDALVLAANFASDMDVLKFVYTSDEYKRASEFLRALSPPTPEVEASAAALREGLPG